MSGADFSQTGTPAPFESARLVRPSLDRRAFLGTVGVAALAASVMPLAAAGLAGSNGPAAAAAPALRLGAASRPEAAASAADELWDIDDMWGHWPRYAHPIPYARVEPSATVWERIDPVDRLLVI